MLKSLKDKITNNKLDSFAHLVALIYAIILFYINFIRIFDNYLWLDECFTGNLVRMSIPNMVKATANDVHPPLYYLIAKAVCSVFGVRGAALHLTSLIPLGLMFLFALSIMWNEFGAECSFVFITFMGISDLAIRYNVEIRMYSWVACLTLFSIWEMYQIVKFDRKNDYILFTIVSLCAAYSHYYSLIAVAFFYAVLFVYTLIMRRKSIIKVIIITLASVVVYLPWLKVIIHSMKARTGNYWIQANDIPTLKQCIVYIFSEHFTPLVWSFAIITLVLTIVYEIGFVKIENKDKHEYLVKLFNKIQYSEVLVLIAAGFISYIGTATVGILVSKYISPFFVVRYMYTLCPIMWMILGITISKMKLSKIWMPIFLAWVLSIQIPAYNAIKEWDLYNFQRNMIVINQKEEIPGNAIIIANYEKEHTIIDYYFWDRELLLVDEDLSTCEIPALDKKEEYWLVLQDVDEYEYDNFFAQLEQQGYISELVSEGGEMGYSTIWIYKCTVQD